MQITGIRNGYLLLSEGGPGYCIATPEGSACHWTFLPRLVLEYGLDTLEIPGEVVAGLRELNARRKHVIGLKTDESVNGTSELFSEYKPFPYQYAGINFALAARRVLIADDVGLGKTIITIGTMLNLFEGGEVQRAIVLCPSSVKYQWRDEIEKFTSVERFPDLMDVVVVVDGGAPLRVSQYASDWSVLIMTYTVFLRDQKHLAPYREGVGMLVADEAKSIQNRETKTAKAVKAYCKDTPYRLALTATPLENKLHDLYGLCEWLDLTVFPGFQWFEREYCKMITMKMRRGRYMIKIPKVVGYKNLEDAKNRMSHVYVRRTFREVGAQLPTVMSSTLRLELTKAQKAVYGAIKDEIDATPDDQKLLVMGKLVRLREACDDASLVGGPVSSCKIDELVRFVDGLPEDDQIVVFSEFRGMTNLVCRALKKWAPLHIHGGVGGMERQLIRKQFDRGDNRVLVMTGAGERGLNLQVAGVLVNVDLPYNPARLKQRIGRIWRLGSEHETVRVINMVTADTFEERVLEVLNRKDRLFDVMFEPDGIDRLGDPVSALGVGALKGMV